MLCCCNINKKMLVMLMLPLIVVGKWKAFNLINADLLLISSRRLWTLNFKVSLRVPQCFELLKHAEAKTEKKTIKLQTWMIRPQADCKHLVYLHLLTSGNTWKQNICRTCYFFPRMTWPPGVWTVDLWMPRECDLVTAVFPRTCHRLRKI